MDVTGEFTAERCQRGRCKDELLLELLLLLLHTSYRAVLGASWSVVEVLQTVKTPGPASCWSSPPGEAVSHEEAVDAWCLPPQIPPATAQR